MNTLQQWLRVVESDDHKGLELPGRVERLLRRPIKITLKDGRTGILTVETMGPGNQPVAVDQATNLSVSVEVDGVFAGSLDIWPNRYAPPNDDYDFNAAVRGSWSVSSVHVGGEFRHQRIATTMYDTLARAGMKILASGGSRGGGKLLPDGESLWDTRRVMKRGRLVYPYPMIWKPKPKSK